MPASLFMFYFGTEMSPKAHMSKAWSPADGEIENSSDHEGTNLSMG
jgi:hypothetical protein